MISNCQVKMKLDFGIAFHLLILIFEVWLGWCPTQYKLQNVRKPEIDLPKMFLYHFSSF